MNVSDNQSGMSDVSSGWVDPVRIPSEPPARVRQSRVRPFFWGIVLGGVAGVIAGTLLSNLTRHLLLRLIQLVGRRLSDAERDHLRFELLLQ